MWIGAWPRPKHGLIQFCGSNANTNSCMWNQTRAFILTRCWCYTALNPLCISFHFYVQLISANKNRAIVDVRAEAPALRTYNNTINQSIRYYFQPIRVIQQIRHIKRIITCYLNVFRGVHKFHCGVTCHEIWPALKAKIFAMCHPKLAWTIWREEESRKESDKREIEKRITQATQLEKLLYLFFSLLSLLLLLFCCKMSNILVCHQLYGRMHR